MSIPSAQELMNPLLEAFHLAGGELLISDQENAVADLCGFNELDLSEMQTPSRSKLSYRLAWARNYLKRLGVISLVEKGKWRLTEKGATLSRIDGDIVSNISRALQQYSNSINGVEEELSVELTIEDIVEPFDPTLIRVESKPATLGQLISRIEHGEIDLAPAFQRKGGIWHEQAQSRLIESILVRIPIPAFYFDATDENNWVVVDGLQRLTTLRKFVVDKTLMLSGLEFLDSQLKGCRYDQLPRLFQRRIDETSVTVFLIEKGTPPQVKFNIFKRINTGGMPLSAQEIRHALNQGKVTELLESLASDKSFRQATYNSIRDDRMADRECVLRFLAFTVSFPVEYRESDFDGFLSEKMREINRLPQVEIELLSEKFRCAMNVAFSIFGRDAFRKPLALYGRRMPINKALFEAWSVNLGVLQDDEQAELMRRRDMLIGEHNMLYFDDAFVEAISQGTGDPVKVRKRFGSIRFIIQKVLK